MKIQLIHTKSNIWYIDITKPGQSAKFGPAGFKPNKPDKTMLVEVSFRGAMQLMETFNFRQHYTQAQTYYKLS